MILAVARSSVRAVLVLLAVSVVVFLATAALPADAALTRTGGRATAEQLVRLRAELGLDRPVWWRYLDWLGGLLTGDLGTSLVADRSVGELVALRLPATLALAGTAAVIAVPAMGVLAWLAGGAGRRSGALTSGLLVVATAVPQIVVAAGLVAVFAGLLGWLPAVSFVPVTGTVFAQPELLVLPALALAVPAAAFGAVLLGGAVADAVRRPHVLDARLRGVAPVRVATRHVLPFLLAPAIRVLALVCGGLIAAGAVVESMFGYAGLGELLVSAVSTRDIPVVQAVAMIAAAIPVAGLAVADAAAILTDPRRRAVAGGLV